MAITYFLACALETYSDLSQPPLTGVKRDAHRLRDILSCHGVHTFDPNPAILSGRSASKQGILNCLRDKTGAAEPGDQLVFFFSGHGFSQGGRYFLAPYDAVFRRIRQDDLEIEGETGISGEELRGCLSNCQATEIVLILDTCHSGGVAIDWDAETQRELLAGNRSVFLIASSRGRESAYRNEGRSLFVESLCQALTGHGIKLDDLRIITAQQALDRADRILSAKTDKLKVAQGPRQAGYAGDIPLTRIERPPNPFPGLSSFSRDQAELFFGRDKASEDLCQLIEQHPVVAVVGFSGCGKSSLIQAGLLPRLQAGEKTTNWRELTLTVSRDCGEMRAALRDWLELGAPQVHEQLSVDINETEAPHESDRDFLERLLNEVRRTAQTHLLILDQFEQVFIGSENRREGQQPAEAFLGSLISETLNPGPSSPGQGELRIVVGLRMDFYPAFHKLTALGAEYQIHLTPVGTEDRLLPRERARASSKGIVTDVIRRPLENVDGRIEDHLVELIYQDYVESAYELPLLQHALSHLWEKSYPGIWLQTDTYVNEGRLIGALNGHADGVVKSLAERILSARQLASSGEIDKKILFLTKTFLLRMVHIVPGGVDRLAPERRLRRLAAKSELTELSASAGLGKEFNEQVGELLLDTLIAERMVTARTSRFSKDPDEVHYQIIHEALLREWRGLGFWIEESDTFLTWREKFWHLFEIWNRDPGFLLTGEFLEQSLNQLKENTNALTSRERAFILESHRGAEAVRRVKSRFLVGALLFFLLLGVGYSAWFLWTGRDAYQINLVLEEGWKLSRTLQDSVRVGNWISAVSFSGAEAELVERIRSMEYEEKAALLALAAVRSAQGGENRIADLLCSEVRNLLLESPAPDLLAQVRLAEAYDILGKAGLSRESLEATESALERIGDYGADPYKRDQVVIEYSAVLISLGKSDLESAYRRLQLLDYPEDGVYRCASAWASKGNVFDSILFLLDNLNDPIQKAAYLLLATRLLSTDDLARVKPFAGNVLQELAVKQGRTADRLSVELGARYGDLGEVGRRAAQIEDPFQRSRVLVSLALESRNRADAARSSWGIRSCSEIGPESYFSQAEEAALAVSLEENRSEAIGHLAEGFAQMGLFRRARELARRYCQDDELLDVYGKILLERKLNSAPSLHRLRLELE